MPFKGTYKKIAKRGGKYNYPKKSPTANLQALVRKAISANNNKMLETKSSLTTQSDGAEMFHNTIIVRNSLLLKTDAGLLDPESLNYANRIGDKITLKGLSIKVMFELNERYSQAQYRIFVVKSAKGDVPTNTTLFNGISQNKMIDTLNTERFTILASKLFSIKQSSTGLNASGIQEIGSGFASGTALISRATKIVKLWVPANKLIKGNVLTYENGSTQPKFYDYHLIYYAYSNYSTTTSFYVGRVNDEVIQLYYKDA